jgi:hypothetical protein
LLPFLDLTDHPGAIFQHRNADPIANSRQVSRAPTLFQPPAQLANDRARLGFYGEETGLGPDDQARNQRSIVIGQCTLSL